MACGHFANQVPGNKAIKRLVRCHVAYILKLTADNVTIPAKMKQTMMRQSIDLTVSQCNLLLISLALRLIRHRVNCLSNFSSIGHVSAYDAKAAETQPDCYDHFYRYRQMYIG